MNKNLINCKTCGKEVSKHAKKCPHCGETLKRFRGLLKFLIVILVIVGIYLGICFYIDFNSKYITKDIEIDKLYCSDLANDVNLASCNVVFTIESEDGENEYDGNKMTVSIDGHTYDILNQANGINGYHPAKARVEKLNILSSSDEFDFCATFSVKKKYLKKGKELQLDFEYGNMPATKKVKMKDIDYKYFDSYSDLKEEL